MRIQIKVPNNSAVTPGTTAVWKLPIGRRYHALQLEYSGTTFNLSHMTAIRVKANGQVLHEVNGAERDSMNQFDGRAAAAGILSIPFDRFSLYSQKGEEATAVQTGTVDPQTGIAITLFELEIDIAVGAVAPAILVTATQSDNDPAVQGPGLILRTLKFTKTFGVSGIQEVADLPKATEGAKFRFLNRTFIKTANTVDLEITRDSYQIFQRKATVNNRVQLDGVRAPQSGYFVFDPTEEGYDFEPIALATPAGQPFQDFRYRLNLSGAETCVFVQEYIGSLQ